MPSSLSRATWVRAVAALLLSLLGVDAAHAQTSCPAAASPGIAGTVQDTESGIALPGARVVIRWADQSRETLSAPDGGFRFCDVPAAAEIALQAFVASHGGVVIQLGRERPVDVEALLSLTAPDRDGEVIAGRGEAWGSGRVLGRIVDARSGEPITGAAIEVGGRSVLSDDGGTFTLDPLPPGPAALSVGHIGYGTLGDTITVLDHATVQLEVRLAASPVELEPIVVTVEEVRDRRLETKGFYERRRVGQAIGIGRYIVREDIERRNPRLLSHMLADFPGTRLICGTTQLRACDLGSVRASGFGCYRMTVFVDGIRVITGDRSVGGISDPRLDDFILPVEVGAVEVYTGAASIPAEFGGASGAQCGVIAIWTRGR